MRLALTDDERRFRDEVRTWLADHLVGDFADHLGVGGPSNAEGWEVRRRWERELAAGGWLALEWPEQWGGRGASVNEKIIFAVEHARARAPYRVGTQGSEQLGPAILAYGTEDLKKRFLPPIAAGEELWCQGYSEPDAGSDLASVRTVARRDGDEWVVDGQKTWTTNAKHSDWMYALCRTEESATPHKGLTLILLPMHQDGVEIRPIKSMAGRSEFNEVFLNGARTSHQMVLGKEGEGFKVALAIMAFERAVSVLPYQLAFEQEMDRVMSYARDSGRLNDPIARRRILDAWIGLQVLSANNNRVVVDLMRQGTLGPNASLSKVFWSEWHQSLGELEMDLMGASSDLVGPDYRLNDFQHSFVLGKAETIYGGTNEIQRNTIGERLLGLAKEPKPSTGVQS